MFELNNSDIEFAGRPLGRSVGEPEFRIIPRYFEQGADGAVEIGDARAIGVVLTLQTVDFEFARAFDANGRPLRGEREYFRRFGKLVLIPEVAAIPCCFPVARLCRESFWDKKSRKLLLTLEIRAASGGNYLQTVR